MNIQRIPPTKLSETPPQKNQKKRKKIKNVVLKALNTSATRMVVDETDEPYVCERR